MDDITPWVQRILRGDRRALARGLSWVENHTPEGRALLRALFPHTGRAHRVGITGPPGVGKSTLVYALARAYRRPSDAAPRKVGVLAVDPSSPFTGGALLGDRIRMQGLAGDPGVFIRSMASRGAVGGLARATAQAAQVLDAAGYDIILIETVGAGQAEVDIARLAHTVIVVQAPGLGDDIQAIKAGILEIADIFVVNKADRPDAAVTRRSLEEMLRLAPARENAAASETEAWVPPVLLTIATSGEGIPELIQAIDAHRAYLERSGEGRRRDAARLRAELEAWVREHLWETWRARAGSEAWDAALAAVLARAQSPDEAAAELVRRACPPHHNP